MKVTHNKEQAKEMVKGKETVLLVDDEGIILDVGEQILEALGYNVLQARGGKESLEIFRENKNQIDLVLFL